MAFSTAGQIINDAAIELGLYSLDLADPFASSDANVRQLCRLLKKCGREIRRVREWTQLQKEYSFVTVANTPTYALPADFGAMINQTGWNRTNRLPLGGPLSPQEWQFLKARLAGVVFTVLFRPQNGLIDIYPDTNTPGGYTIAYEYLSTYWVAGVLPIPAAPALSISGFPGVLQAGTYAYRITAVTADGETTPGAENFLITALNNIAVQVTWAAVPGAVSYNVYGRAGGAEQLIANVAPGTPNAYIDAGTVAPSGAMPTTNTAAASSPTRDSPATFADVLYFDPQLLMLRLKMAFLQAKGFDSAAAQDEYDTALMQATSDDAIAPILRFGSTSHGFDKLLDSENNTPITGFGAA